MTRRISRTGRILSTGLDFDPDSYRVGFFQILDFKLMVFSKDLVFLVFFEGLDLDRFSVILDFKLMVFSKDWVSEQVIGRLNYLFKGFIRIGGEFR